MKQGIGAAICLIVAAVVFWIGYTVGKSKADFTLMNLGSGITLKMNRATGESWVYVPGSEWRKIR